MEILADLRIGSLHPDDVAAVNYTECVQQHQHLTCFQQFNLSCRCQPCLRFRDSSDPYSHDPMVLPIFKFHQAKPLNAEPPSDSDGKWCWMLTDVFVLWYVCADSLLTDAWLTPVDLWFVRNHLPVPILNADSFRFTLKVPIAASSTPVTEGAAAAEPTTQPQHREIVFSLDELKSSFPHHTVPSSNLYRFHCVCC